MSYLKKKIDSYQFSSQSKPDLKAGTMSRRSYRSALGNALNSQVKEEKKVCAFVFFDMLGRYRRLLLLQSTSKTYKTDITAPGNSRQMLLLTRERKHIHSSTNKHCLPAFNQARRLCIQIT